MNTPTVLGIAIVLYLLTCIRAWRKLTRLERHDGAKAGEAMRIPRSTALPPAA